MVARGGLAGQTISRTLTVTTPENVDVFYEPAAIGTRSIAVALDHLLQVLIMLAGLFVMATVAFGLGNLGRVFAANVPFWLTAASLVWVFIVFWGYFILFEILWSGQTPGKRLTGLRVLRDGGYQVDPFCVVIRNVVRLADALPPLYGAGIVSMFLSRQCKRLGDWAAGTVVVKERRRPLPSPSLLGEPTPEVAAFMELVPPLLDLPGDLYGVLRRFVERRHAMTIPVQAHIALRLAEQILPAVKLEMDLPAQLQYADLLEAILRKYMAERGKV